MSNVKYIFSDDGLTAYGELPGGEVFVIDADMVDKIKTVKFFWFYNCHRHKRNIIDIHACSFL